MYINVILALMFIASFLVAIPLHELGHVLMASLLGDKTPRNEGRQTLSPRVHNDPLGVLFCVLLAFQPGFSMGFGWGKPVKPDPWKMRVGPNTGLLLVAIAGPLFSLIIGLLTALILHFLPEQMLITTSPLARISQLLLVFATVNISLVIFNLIPLYPLDGYSILYTLLPSRQAVSFQKSAPYGTLIILALFFLLPFLARLSPGLSSFPLFQLANYILEGSLRIVSIIAGPLVNIGSLYIY